jgi:hypothetical protein
MNAVRWLALLLLVAAVLWIRLVPPVFRVSGLVTAQPTPERRADDAAAAVIARFGKPDAVFATAGPPGALRTRVLTHRDLRIVFVQRDSDLVARGSSSALSMARARTRFQAKKRSRAYCAASSPEAFLGERQNSPSHKSNRPQKYNDASVAATRRLDGCVVTYA